MTFPVKFAVIVPALKFPLASRATMAELVFTEVAVVAELLTFPGVAIVANLVSTIAAVVAMSAFTIVASAILADVTASFEMIGAAADEPVPAKSPANCNFPFVDALASAIVAEATCASTYVFTAFCVG